jgi:hypothetical protein
MDICPHALVFSNLFPLFPSTAIVDPARIILLHQTIRGARCDSNDVACSNIPPEAWSASCAKILNITPHHAALVLDIFADCFPGHHCTLRRLLLFMFVCKHYYTASAPPPTDTAWPSPPSPGRRLNIATSPRALALQVAARDKARARTFIRKHAADLLDVVTLGSENVMMQALDILAFVMPVAETSLPCTMKSSGHLPLVEAIKWIQSQDKECADTTAAAEAPAATDSVVAVNSKSKTVVIRVKCSTAIVSPTDLPHDVSAYHLRIESCESSFVYVIAAFKSVTVIGCTDSNVFCGACAASARVEHCEACVIQVAARRLFATNVVDSDVYVLTPKSPIICGECRSMRIAPLNIFAPNLQSVLDSAGLGVDRCSINRWDMPLYLDIEGVFRSKSESTQGQGVSLLPPALFFPCSVPVPGSPERSLTPIPTEFAMQIEEKMRSLSAVKARLSQATAPNTGVKGIQVPCFRSVTLGCF